MAHAYVLAGGRSSRMGEDKAFITLAGRTLLEAALAKASAVADAVYLVGPAAKFSGLGIPLVEDRFSGAGPLAGIHAALSATTGELNLVMGLDTPFLSEEFLRYLVQQAQDFGATVTVPRAAGHFEPLCAVYRREFAAVAEAALRRGEYRIAPLFAQVRCHVIEEDEIARFEPGAAMFDNLNTPEDLQRAQADKPA